MSDTIVIIEEISTVTVNDESSTVTVTSPGPQGATGPTGEGVPAGGTTGQVLKKNSDTDYDTSWQAPGAAPTAAQVVFTPAGNLAADDVQEALEELDTEKAAATHTHDGADITTGTVADARIASTIARDSEVTAAIATSEAGQVRDGDAAGGVLAGTYPNPSFASDMATQAELDAVAATASAGDATVQGNLDAHIADTTDAHDASAISILDTANDFTATDVEGALAELQSDAEADAQALSDHLADTTDAHDASAISVDSTTLSGTGTNVQASLEEIDNLLDDHSSRHEEGGADQVTVTVGQMDAEASGFGQVPTSDGAGGVSWQDQVADIVNASDVIVDSTALSGTGTDAQSVFQELDDLLDAHHTRHENGGADEISIAGLDGTPTELANHLSDATDAHDASAISIVDSGDYFTGTDVEAALQELGAASGGGGSGTDFSRSIAQTAHGLAVGDVVRYSGTAYVKAQADSAANAEVVGMVSAVADVDNFTLCFGGRITGLSGLTAGTVYFLSPSSAGALTATEPSSLGQVSKPVLVADSTTSGYFGNFRGYTVGTAETGWINAGETWTYSSADDPTYVFQITGADKTGKYTAGMRVRLTQSTGGTKYFIITKVALSGSDTLITVYGGTDYDLNNETISSPYYSMHKAPQGFPLNPLKWTIEVTDTTQRSQASAVASTWYNLGSVSITIPIGAWDVSYTVAAQMTATSTLYTTLSTANNSESDTGFSTQQAFGNTTPSLRTQHYARKHVLLAAKTVHYLNTMTSSGATPTILNINDATPAILRAVCAYL